MNGVFSPKLLSLYYFVIGASLLFLIYEYMHIGLHRLDNRNYTKRKFGIDFESELSIRNEPTTLLDLPTIFNIANKKTNISTVKNIILWYNPPPWMEKRQRSVFMDRCEYNNCIFTLDRRYLHNSSAVVFGLTTPGRPSNPPLSPQERNPNQIWVAHSLEPPVYKSLDWTNVINWTMTYRFDSDVLAPYGTIKSRENPPIRNYTEIFQRKQKMAAWIVSHCHAVSKRDEYVAELIKAGVEVDIFGNCGKSIRHLNNKQVEDLLNSYMFFLSFENTLCKDYITEKVFNKYNLDLILIVRGGADYDKLLPTKTFINTAHFPNISSLASHVLQLANNKHDYIELLKLKDKYEAMATFGYSYSICNLCRKLNNIGHNRKSYRKITDFLQDKTCRLAEDIPNFFPAQINSNIYATPKRRSTNQPLLKRN